MSRKVVILYEKIYNRLIGRQLVMISTVPTISGILLWEVVYLTIKVLFECEYYCR